MTALQYPITMWILDETLAGTRASKTCLHLPYAALKTSYRSGKNIALALMNLVYHTGIVSTLRNALAKQRAKQRRSHGLYPEKQTANNQASMPY